MAIFVIPAFNEEANVPRLLDDLESRPALWRGGWVVLVDDGSSDGTVAAARAHVGDLPIEMLVPGAEPGRRPRVRPRLPPRARASRRADALIVTLESDTTSDLDALEEMLATAHSGADVVLASHHDQGELVNVDRAPALPLEGGGVRDPALSGLDAKTVSSFFRVYRAQALRDGLRALRRRRSSASPASPARRRS